MQSSNNAMREAFLNAKVHVQAVRSPLVVTVVGALSTNAGAKKVGRGWSANVSKRTLAALTKEGVFA
jgi:hypothetical protein